MYYSKEVGLEEDDEKVGGTNTKNFVSAALFIFNSDILFVSAC